MISACVPTCFCTWHALSAIKGPKSLGQLMHIINVMINIAACCSSWWCPQHSHVLYIGNHYCSRPEMYCWQGAQPQILYCQHGSTSVRLVYTVMPAPVAGKKSTEKQGSQLRGDNKKPIVAMTCHPSGAVTGHLAMTIQCHGRHAAPTMRHTDLPLGSIFANAYICDCNRPEIDLIFYSI